MDSLWIVIASMLAVFNVTQAEDKDGDTIEVSPQWTDSLIRYGVGIIFVRVQLVTDVVFY